MRVFISDIDAIKSRHDNSVFYELVGQLQSGLEIYINSYHFNLERYLGSHVEMLLCVLRSPYLERGEREQLFFPEDYYSLELTDELLKEKSQNPEDNSKEIRLIGEYIDSYTIPEEWIPLITSRFFKNLLKEPSALRTEDGVFFLSPIHLRKRVPIEKFPQTVTIATGCIDLAAWHPL